MVLFALTALLAAIIPSADAAAAFNISENDVKAGATMTGQLVVDACVNNTCLTTGPECRRNSQKMTIAMLTMETIDTKGAFYIHHHESIAIKGKEYFDTTTSRPDGLVGLNGGDQIEWFHADGNRSRRTSVQLDMLSNPWVAPGGALREQRWEEKVGSHDATIGKHCYMTGKYCYFGGSQQSPASRGPTRREERRVRRFKGIHIALTLLSAALIALTTVFTFALLVSLQVAATLAATGAVVVVGRPEFQLNELDRQRRTRPRCRGAPLRDLRWGVPGVGPAARRILLRSDGPVPTVELVPGVQLGLPRLVHCNVGGVGARAGL
jgi:hypothetical protein